MSCCNCYLWDWDCLKKKADIPLTTQVEVLDSPYSVVFYDLEERLGRACMDELCSNKESYTEVLDELLPFFAVNLSIQYKIRNLDLNYSFTNGARTDDNIDNAMQSPAIQSLVAQSKTLWRRFENWILKHKDKYPDVCKNCLLCYCETPKPNYSNFYRGRNITIR